MTCYRPRMRKWKAMVIAAFVASGLGSALVAPPEAQASVSIAVAFDELVKNTVSVGVMTPVEQYSAWEDKRIYTFTRVHVDDSIAGSLGTGSEAWVVTAGGIVGNVGQHVDGEAVLHVGEPTLLFLKPDPKSPGLHIVTTRGQGQFIIQRDAATNLKRLHVGNGTGAVLPPRANLTASAVGGSVSDLKTNSVTPSKGLLLATDAIHGKPLDEVARNVASAWRRLHAQ